MNFSQRTVSKLVVCGLILLLTAVAGVRYAAAQEMPITAKSKEALKLFLDGRAKSEDLHTEEAHKLFVQAAAKDPDFALAHLLAALTAADTKLFYEEMKKAVSLAANVSKGEQLLIAANQAASLEDNAVKSHDLYRQLAEMFPSDKRTHIYFGGSYAGREEYDKAIAEYEKAVTLDKDYIVAHYRIAYIFVQRGDFDKAEEHFKAYLRLAPREPNPYDCLADLYQKMGRFDDAIKHYREAVNLDPHFSFSEYKIGVSYVFMGRGEEGRQAMEKAKEMELEPANKIGDEDAIARSYAYAGDYKKAIEGEDKAIQMAHELGQLQAAGSPNLFKCLAYCELKDYDKAAQCIADYRKCLEDPVLPRNIKEDWSANPFFFEALVAADQRDITKAAAKSAEFRTRIARINNPLFPKYADWLDGYVSLAKGDYAGANALFSKAVIDDPFFYYYGAVAKERAGDAAGAKKLYAKVASWNADGYWYPFVWNKAKAKI